MAEDGDDVPSIGARHLQEMRDAQTPPSPPPPPAPGAPPAGEPAAGPAPAAAPGEAGGQGWWQASDGRWYPPETHPTAAPAQWSPGYQPPPDKGNGAKVALAIVGGLVALIVVLIAAVAVFGKSRPSTSKTASSPGVSAGTGDGFAATFPFEPKRTTQQIQQAGISATVIIYDCLGSDEEVGVGVTQFPLTPDVSAADRILAGSIMGEADKTGTTVATQSATTYLGYPARDAVMTKDGTAIKSRVFLAGARLISLTSVTRSDADSRPGYERLLSTFHLQA